MANINLINEKNSKLDLSSVKDAKGEMVILQPKGAKGSQRECHEDVLEHPHVVSFLNAKWLRYEDVSLTPIETKTHNPPPATPPAPAAPPVLPPADDIDVRPASEPSVEETPAAEEGLTQEDAPASELPPVVTSSEAVDVGESLNTTVTSSNRKKKHGRD